MTLPAFAAERRAATSAGAIDISCRTALSSNPAATAVQ